MYNGKFYSQLCVTVAFLEPWHIQKIAKYLRRNILFKTFCNTDIFRTLAYSEHILTYSEIKAYSEPCQISKIEHFIKNCVTIADLKAYIFKTLANSEPVCVSYSLMQPRPQIALGTRLLLNVSAIF